MLEDAELDSSRSEKKAKRLVDAHAAVKNSRFKLRITLKAGIEELPDNRVMAEKRLDSLRKRAIKDKTWRDFLIRSFRELEDLTYVEPVNENKVLDIPMWYIPYFVTSQARKRILYDGRAEFKGVCINDVIETGPNLLNSLADILARFWLDKYGMITDLTKSFFQLGLPPHQRYLFCILWFDNHDIGEGKVKVFWFTRHL